MQDVIAIGKINNDETAGALGSSRNISDIVIERALDPETQKKEVSTFIENKNINIDPDEQYDLLNFALNVVSLHVSSEYNRESYIEDVLRKTNEC